jgi:hypothetical protein
MKRYPLELILSARLEHLDLKVNNRRTEQLKKILRSFDYQVVENMLGECFKVTFNHSDWHWLKELARVFDQRYVVVRNMYGEHLEYDLLLAKYVKL